MPRIAIDAMGGDRAPAVVIDGVLLAAQDLGVEMILVGERAAIEQQLAKILGHPSLRSSARRRSYQCTNRRPLRCVKKIRP